MPWRKPCQEIVASMPGKNRYKRKLLSKTIVSACPKNASVLFCLCLYICFVVAVRLSQRGLADIMFLGASRGGSWSFFSLAFLLVSVFVRQMPLSLPCLISTSLVEIFFFVFVSTSVLVSVFVFSLYLSFHLGASLVSKDTGRWGNFFSLSLTFFLSLSSLLPCLCLSACLCLWRTLEQVE